ncbi:EVE domain-containing protein [Dinoroseobacter sp. S375]|uniref:EVE domain-containing protein n=1 Tax=Dinoroseobacter sp. S375 TaxID=3415136 RepID=UPI003C7E10E3
MARYWIGLAERDSVHAAVANGVCVFSGGKASPVRKLEPGDGILYYSPHESAGGAVLECFTAVGEVVDDAPWTQNWTQICAGGPYLSQGAAHQSGLTWVRRCDYDAVGEVSVRPLLSELRFVAQPRHWGRTFHRGQMEIGAADFFRIADRLRAVA